MFHNLFCQTGDCDSLAFWGDERIGFWCKKHYREVESLLAQKLGQAQELTEWQWFVWCVMQEKAIAARQEAAHAAG